MPLGAGSAPGNIVQIQILNISVQSHRTDLGAQPPRVLADQPPHRRRSIDVEAGGGYALNAHLGRAYTITSRRFLQVERRGDKQLVYDKVTMV